MEFQPAETSRSNLAVSICTLCQMMAALHNFVVCQPTEEEEEENSFPIFLSFSLDGGQSKNAVWTQVIFICKQHFQIHLLLCGHRFSPSHPKFTGK